MTQSKITHLIEKKEDTYGSYEAYYFIDEDGSFVLEEMILLFAENRGERSYHWKVSINVNKDQFKRYSLKKIKAYISDYPIVMKEEFEIDEQYPNYNEVFEKYDNLYEDEGGKLHCLSKTFENQLKYIGVSYQKKLEFLNEHSVRLSDENGIGLKDEDA